MEEVSSSRLKRKLDSCGDCDAAETCKADPHINPLYCSVCDVSCNSTAMMEKHVNGKKHKKQMLGQSRTTIHTWKFWCDSCLVGCNSDATMKMHLDGKMHKESSCKRRRLLQVEIKKEDCNEKEEEIEQVCIKEEELIKPVEITQETCSFEEEELKAEEDEFSKVDVCDDEKMQDEADHQIIKEEEIEQVLCIKEEELKVGEEEFKNDVCDDEKMQDEANQIIKEEKAENTSGKDGLWCDICELQCNSYPMMLAHRSGKKHTAKEAKAGFKVEKDQAELEQDKKMREMKEETNKEFWCLICRVTFDTQGKIAKHLKGAEHKAKVTSRG